MHFDQTGEITDSTYLRQGVDGTKTVQYSDFKRAFCFNLAEFICVLDDNYRKHARFQLRTDGFQTPLSCFKMNPSRYYTFVFKETCRKVLKHGIVVSWDEVPLDRNNHPVHKNIVFTNEALLIMPILLNLVKYQDVKTLDQFMHKVNKGRAVEEIFKMEAQPWQEEAYILPGCVANGGWAGGPPQGKSWVSKVSDWFFLG